MEEKSLEELGLSKGEARVYLALLKLGKSKTGPLAKHAHVSSSKVYKILDRLHEKGLIGIVKEGKTKVFSAQAPARLNDYLDEEEEHLAKRKETLDSILPVLEKQYNLAPKNDAVIFAGIKGVTNFFRNIIDELKSGETYYVIGATYGERESEFRRFFYKHHERRIEKKIRVMMLANANVRGNLEKTTRGLSERRYLPEYLISNMEIVFYKNKVFFALLTKEPIGFLVENDEMAKGLKTYFDTFWKIAKK